jgi:hypothetical protein
MTIDVESLTVREVRELSRLAGCVSEKRKPEPLPFKVGDAILIRTVTMIQLGRVKTIGRDFFVLEEAGWVADTARFSETLEKGTLNEFEKAPSWVLVGRGAVIDVYPWTHALPKATK